MVLFRIAQYFIYFTPCAMTHITVLYIGYEVDVPVRCTKYIIIINGLGDGESSIR